MRSCDNCGNNTLRAICYYSDRACGYWSPKGCLAIWYEEEL